jgi:thiamine-monophosphate kinase
MPSEKQILDELRARYGKARVRGLRLGIGDDAALLRSRAGCELVVTTDLFLEQVHFRREWTSARNAGSKAAARALSDIAAMGAIPRFVFLSVAVPRRLSGRWLEEFFRGAVALSRRFAVALAGGDLASSPDRVVLDVVGVGEVERGRALLRSGARPGDAIFVLGYLFLAGPPPPAPFPNPGIDETNPIPAEGSGLLYPGCSPTWWQVYRERQRNAGRGG